MCFEFSVSLGVYSKTYYNIYLYRDLHIDISSADQKHNSHFAIFRNTYDLLNLIQVSACFKSEKLTSVDVILGNKPRSFQKTIKCKTDLCNRHMLIAEVLRFFF